MIFKKTVKKLNISDRNKIRSLRIQVECANSQLVLGNITEKEYNSLLCNINNQLLPLEVKYGLR